MKAWVCRLSNRSFILHLAAVILALLWLAFTCSCISTARDAGGPTTQVEAAQAVINEDEVDAAIERAARAALGEREGAVVVMDAQNGRLRAVVNPHIAFEQAFPPGSAIKPFTALAALRAGLIDAETNMLCPAHYEREDFHIACTHPKSKAPLDLAHAIGYSCNYYFARVGERLSAGAFERTLTSFGFGERTGVNATNESAGALRRGDESAGDVLGEGDHLLVTPIQLARAYAALTNGGHLYRPQRAPAKDFVAQPTARINIAAQHRTTLIKGMRGATAYGTAAAAGLDTLSVKVYGKTGTSASSNGFRTQGWFVGVLDDALLESSSKPESVRLIVLVFLKRAHGAESAEIARPIFEEYLRARSAPTESNAAIASRNDAGSRDGSAATASDAETDAMRFRVKVTTRSDSSADVESTMRSLTLEEYVGGVLAAESSTENEIEALKAQSVVVRTFALKNRGRHAEEGFDFCTTTHCERFVFTGDTRSRPTSNAAAIDAAVTETRGEVLQDGRGQLVDSYFSVACGGMTANIQSLWGTTAAPVYLRGVSDDYCATMPHHHWTDIIPARQLLKALRSDPQTDVGARLNDVIVTRRDATGRAEAITLEGERRKTVRGWDFKLIVGRALGWNLLKSSRFTVARAGTNFVFRGGGFGHGLGLCQEGAHVMALRGSNYKQIVAKYFPGTSVSTKTAAQAERAALSDSVSSSSFERVSSPSFDHVSRSPLSMSPASYRNAATPALQTIRMSRTERLILSSDHFQVSYPSTTTRREVDTVLRILEAARADIERRLAIAGLVFPADTSLNIFINETTQDFIAATGQPGWAAAATRGSRMELQPLAFLRRRGIVVTTLRHEYAHFVIDLLGQGKTPRWLSEGLAIYVAGEGAMLAPFKPKSKLTREEIERRLERPASADEMRSLYAASFNEVRALVRAEGEKGVWHRVAQSSN